MRAARRHRALRGTSRATDSALVCVGECPGGLRRPKTVDLGLD